MSLQDLEVLGYAPKELEKLRDEFNISEESIKFHAVMIRLYGTDPRINPVSQGTTAMSDSGTFMEEIRNEAKKAIRN
jgi:hypothetical protein